MSHGKKISGQTLTEWLRDFIGQHHAPAPFDLTDARAHAYNLLPRGFIPSLDSLVSDWWTETFRKRMQQLGYGLTESNSTGLTVVDPVQLSFDDLWGMCVRRLRLSKDDIDAVRVDLEAWAIKNNPALNVDATMDALLAAAGF